MKATSSVVALLAAVTAAVIVPEAATAASRSFAVARDRLPAETNSVIGANITDLRQTAIYQQMMPGMLAMLPDAEHGLEVARTTCGFDVMESIRDVTVAMTPDNRGIIVTALRKVGPSELLACAQKLAGKPGKRARITRSVREGITEYTIPGQPDRVYVAWLAGDVVAMASDPRDRAELKSMIGGAGIGGELAAAAGEVDTGAEVWLAIAERRPVGEGEMTGTMKSAHGALEFAGPDLTIMAGLALASAEEARQLTKVLERKVGDSLPDLPPELARMARNTRFVADGDTARVIIKTTEHDLMSLLGATMTEIQREQAGAAPPETM